jgi:hypothetical protein
MPGKAEVPIFTTLLPATNIFVVSVANMAQALIGPWARSAAKKNKKRIGFVRPNYTFSLIIIDTATYGLPKLCHARSAKKITKRYCPSEASCFMNFRFKKASMARLCLDRARRS